MALLASGEVSSKWVGVSGEGHAHDQLRNRGNAAEESKLCHKEAMGRLKSALQAIGVAKEVGKMGEESSGVVGVPIDSHHQC